MSPLTAADLGEPLAAALAAATEDRLVYDLAGIERRHDTLLEELPGVQ
ncbi:type III PLP-dependent enzyme, partial [Streptomyces sp. SID5926]|nr:type III PLP-dependent enzyme [Streptomyces sp. SID5926]